MTVYMIGSEGHDLVKIGYTDGPLSRRLSSLGTGSPDRLAVLWAAQGGPDIEQKLHEAFAKHRVRGEWFRLGPDAVERVNALVPGGLASQDARERRSPALHWDIVWRGDEDGGTAGPCVRDEAGTCYCTTLDEGNWIHTRGAKGTYLAPYPTAGIHCWLVYAEEYYPGGTRWYDPPRDDTAAIMARRAALTQPVDGC